MLTNSRLGSILFCAWLVNNVVAYTALAYDVLPHPVGFGVKGDNWLLAMQDPEQDEGDLLVLTREKALRLPWRDRGLYVYQSAEGRVLVGTSRVEIFDILEISGQKVRLRILDLWSLHHTTGQRSPWSFAVEDKVVAVQTVRGIFVLDGSGNRVEMSLDLERIAKDSFDKNPELEKTFHSAPPYVDYLIVHPRLVDGDVMITSDTALYKADPGDEFRRIMDISEGLRDQYKVDGIFVINQSAVSKAGNLFLLGQVSKFIQGDSSYVVVRISLTNFQIEQVITLNDEKHGAPIGLSLSEELVNILYVYRAPSYTDYTLLTYDTKTLKLVSRQQRRYKEVFPAVIEISD